MRSSFNDLIATDERVDLEVAYAFPYNVPDKRKYLPAVSPLFTITSPVLPYN